MPKKIILPLILLIFLLPACGQGAPPPAATADPLTLDLIPKPVELTAEDDVLLKATYYPPHSTTAAPGLLLLHMLGSNKEAWQDFAGAAQEAGFAVLALDLRDHGESGGDSNFEMMDSDVSLALTWLKQRPEVASNRLGLAGASIGANLALRGAATHPEVQSVALLSPGLDYRGLTILDALSNYGRRPIMIVASEGDVYSAEAAQTLNTQALGEHRLQIYPGNEHGTDIFQAQAGLQPMLLAWFETTL